MFIINVGDLHISGRNPRARKDDLTIVQFKKLEEIVSISNDYDAPIISVGDILDTSNISGRFQISAMEHTISSLRIFSFCQPVSQQHNFRKI